MQQITYETNLRLANDYRQLTDARSLERGACETLAKRIEHAPIDLLEFYRQHGSLRELEVRGIGSTMKTDLECILRGELAEACTKGPQIREAKWRRLNADYGDAPYPGPTQAPKQPSNEGSGSWDNTTKLFED